ncbi:LysR family transcriptional regulator [Vibrio sp.]|uniref:LysR family transcriptional regulator n=1 Tax=Vibrio sp. TaxID=678 RepID=UPI003D140C39
MDKLTTMRAFAAVVEQGSFSRAAEKLQLSPQLVSKYVSHLEGHLNTRLFHRTTRKVSLTEAGRHYYQSCMQVLEDIDEMENALSDMDAEVRGKLTISAPMSFGSRHLPQLLVDFQRKHREIAVDIRLEDRKVNIVEEGIDVALRIGKLPSSSLIAKKIVPVKMAICASPDYLREYGEPESLDDLAQHRFLKYSYGDPVNLFQGVTHSSDIKLSAKLVANNGDLLVNAAVCGGGIIVQPTFIAGDAISHGQLKVILPGMEPDPLYLYAVYANRQFLARKVRAFIDFVSDYYGEQPYWDNLSQQ